MDKNSYLSYPDKITVREFQCHGVTYVSTFTNHKKFHKKDLEKLYAHRWQVEVNLRDIKNTLGMDVLSCKSPDMIEKEISVHMLAYNIIRAIMAEACCNHNAVPSKISFKGSVQLINQFMPRYAQVNSLINQALYETMLKLIVSNKVANRPGRVEPRKIKRRRKPFPLLHKKRREEIKKLEKRQKRRKSKNAMA